MLFRISFLTLLTVLAVSASSVSLSFGALLGWNDLLYGKGIFDEEIDSIQVKSNDDNIVLGQLTELLSQDTVLEKVYSKYQKMLSKDETDTFTQDGSSRIKFFKSKLVEIATHNLEARNGKHSWVQGVNQFTDRTKEELSVRKDIKIDRLGFPLQNDSLICTSGRVPFLPKAPEALDWRDRNVVTSVKDQGNCNSCAMFASTGALESVNAILKGITFPQSLSPQELVDCAVPEFTCPESPGSRPLDSYNYLQNVGVSTFKSYPYNSRNPKKGICQARMHVARIGSYCYGMNRPEEELKKRVAAFGPVYAAINAPFKYEHGIMPRDACLPSTRADHGVLIVGYGTSDQGVPYWIIKNSWGTQSWGNETGGYLYLARNADFACQISNDITISITNVV